MRTFPALLLLACSDYEFAGNAEPQKLPAPDIEVTPASLNFATVGVGCDAEKPLTITNVGEAPLTIDGSAIEGDPGFEAELVVTTLDPGESVVMAVRFVPEDATPGRAKVVVTSDDPDEHVSEVPAVGTGEFAGLATDSFVQEVDPVDVLWVIDNSSSMGTEQARVMAEISAFFSWFDTLRLDYHMGVIATDVVSPQFAGQLVGSPTYLEKTTPDAETRLAERINLGTDDMGDESGLLAVEMALTDPLLNGYNAGFLRPDARLAVIFLSDEPEQSAYDAQHYIDFLKTLKSDPSRVLVASIVGDYTNGCANTCDDVEQRAGAGDKYIDVTTAYDGVFGSICTCDLSPTLDEIGMKSTLFSRSFALSQVPSDSTEIRVWIDGEETSAFVYDAENNAVVFDGAPLNGSQIDLEYPVDDGCDD
ncbi:MAG: choice-of-anchor D domain-containing protein [Deltaproteobacteria bacterium]|nr:choice-of-anchor D domain-containing protein [Deltaproteobacteria bacterium]